MSMTPETTRTGAPSVRIAALVDLIRRPDAGGHVKCWERIAAAAARLDEPFDLTVHFSGEAPGRHDLSERVRFVMHPPVFSTARLPFLSHVPDHTDLAPWHFGLARALADCDVIHTTDAYFAFARTASAIAARRKIPLINSIHTDTPGYARVFTRATVHRLLGRGAVSRWLLDVAKVHENAARNMTRKLLRHQQRSRFALVSNENDYRAATAALAPDRVKWLRRGIDRARFSPGLRDRAWLASEYGAPEDRVLILAVGRVNVGKNIMILARAVKTLAARGAPVHLFCAGDGEDRAAIESLLGPAATCPGVVSPERLARIYACADIFAMPSEIEVFANVVMEALASGVPALVSERGGMGRLLRPGETGEIVCGAGEGPWVEALSGLVADSERRGRMAAAAAQTALPTWEDVVREDLWPLWRAAFHEIPVASAAARR